ncbi:MAG: hypothetical protein ACI8WT_001732 [Clostridium sp.]|jgi:hypothetical protein
MSRITALKNKISKLQIKIIALSSTLTADHVAVLDKEIIELKQEGHCKQVGIDSLECLLEKSKKELRYSIETIIELENNILLLESKKIKNRFKKLFVS